MFVDPIRAAIYRLAPGPVKTPQDLMYWGQNARAMGIQMADPESYKGVADLWSRGQLTSDGLEAQLQSLKIAESLDGRMNEGANRFLNAAWTAALAAGAPAAAAALGTSIWNTGVNSDQEVNAGDVARAAAVLGAIGGTGLWLGGKATGRSLGRTDNGIAFMTPQEKQAYAQALYERRNQPQATVVVP